jgi:hypothetical protein
MNLWRDAGSRFPRSYFNSDSVRVREVFERFERDIERSEKFKACCGVCLDSPPHAQISRNEDKDLCDLSSNVVSEK